VSLASKVAGKTLIEPMIVVQVELDNYSGADISGQFRYNRETGVLQILLTRKGEPFRYNVEDRRWVVL